MASDNITFTSVQVDPIAKARIESEGSAFVRAFNSSTGNHILRSLDDTLVHGKLRHLSISHQERLPTWEEVKTARYKLMPHEIDVMMVLPRPADYVNLHSNCFHLWEIPEKWGIG